MNEHPWIVFPVLEEYDLRNVVAKQIEPFIGDHIETAFNILGCDSSYRNFRDYCDFKAALVIDGLPEGNDGLAGWNQKRWLDFWYSSAVELYLRMFFEEQDAIYRRIIGNRWLQICRLIAKRSHSFIVEVHVHN